MILNLLGELYNKENRFQAACRIAEFFGCTHLIIFIPDPEIGQLLPAIGFPQTLPDGKAWNNFLQECSIKGYHSGTLSFPDSSQQIAASGFGSEGGNLVLLGGTPDSAVLQPLRDSLPLLAELFKLEQAVIASEIRLTMAQKSAEKAEKLARTIDVMRLQLKEALARKEKDKEDIEILMKKKDEFMNVASHELKTPITNMKGYLQIAKKELVKKNGLAISFVDKADDQINKLTSLVNDLLDVTKIHAGKMEYHFCDLDISKVISEAIDHAQVSAPTHQIIIKKSTKAVVRGEKNRLEQVLSNFLSNAIKYSPHADKIIVNTDLIGSEIKVSVRDFGIGIPFEEKNQVFDRFYRVRESSQQFSGLGLGLYISSEIVRRHGGDIGVVIHEKGSEFYFSLPVSEGTEV